VTTLPRLSNRALEALFFNRPLESVKGAEAWALSGNPFPSNYHGGAISFTEQNCKNCHNKTNTPFRNFVNHFSGAWSELALYGNSPGSDGVISFYPWDVNLLAQFSNFNGQDTRRIRTELAGIFEPYNKRKHRSDIYTPFAR